MLIKDKNKNQSELLIITDTVGKETFAIRFAIIPLCCNHRYSFCQLTIGNFMIIFLASSLRLCFSTFHFHSRGYNCHPHGYLFSLTVPDLLLLLTGKYASFIQKFMPVENGALHNIDQSYVTSSRWEIIEI